LHQQHLHMRMHAGEAAEGVCVRRKTQNRQAGCPGGPANAPWSATHVRACTQAGLELLPASQPPAGQRQFAARNSLGGKKDEKRRWIPPGDG